MIDDRLQWKRSPPRRCWKERKNERKGWKEKVTIDAFCIIATIVINIIIIIVDVVDDDIIIVVVVVVVVSREFAIQLVNA